ncbi:MAG: NAD(P)H-dependent oxidoreductase subunit E [Leptospirales bacterium]|nr:NAD(P)H-dependent oxidoreductase subunit E [Leptospirales bacterium]
MTGAGETLHFSAAASVEVDRLLADFPNPRSALLMVMRVAEREFGALNDAAMELVARTCGVSPSHVLGMATFYTHFKRPAHGKHRLMVCATLICDLGGAGDALQVIYEMLGLRPGQRTADGLFSLEKVECLADCNRPPAMQIDGLHLSGMNRQRLQSVVLEYLGKEGKSAGAYRAEDAVEMDLRTPVISVKQAAPGQGAQSK